MKKQLLVVGNPTDPLDSKPQQLVTEIQHMFPQLVFIPWDPTEELPASITKEIIIIDAIQGINDVTLFHSLDEFVVSPRNTVHDFDLPVALKLLQKIRKISAVTIIGIPYKETKKEITHQLITILQSI